MSDKRKTTKRDKKRSPAFLITARRFYGEAFGSRTRRAYLESLADWAELSEDDQTFTLAHLQYLNLLAQARTQSLLIQVRDLLDEVAEGIGELVDEPDEDDDDDQDQDQAAETLEGDDGFEDLDGEPEHQPEAEPELPPEADLEPERDDGVEQDPGGEE